MHQFQRAVGGCQRVCRVHIVAMATVFILEILAAHQVRAEVMKKVRKSYLGFGELSSN